MRPELFLVPKSPLTGRKFCGTPVRPPPGNRSDSTSLVLLGTGDRVFLIIQKLRGGGEDVPPPPPSGHLLDNSDFSARNFRFCLPSGVGKTKLLHGTCRPATRTQPIFSFICLTKHQSLLHLTSCACITPTLFGCICRRRLIAIVTGIPRIPLPPETWCQMSP